MPQEVLTDNCEPREPKTLTTLFRMRLCATFPATLAVQLPAPSCQGLPLASVRPTTAPPVCRTKLAGERMVRSDG
jgi:hypothetical protein